ncbi:MAG: hypothetical protein HYX28_05210 [Candidatus Koribacter versatilis]|uniref:FG-GAP repeat protein n=1 Tax=Candidatus Korobacter versatilis TaxID=658062 RepID=A0A932A7J0_9BACT|nr:hypothetical protein [Candidatus Koribacter versatilis]
MRALRIACLLVVVFLLFSAAFAQTATPAGDASRDTSKDKATPDAATKPAPTDAEKNSAADGAPEVPADLQQVVNKQFGPGFKVALQRATPRRYLHDTDHEIPWTPLLITDLDGDGVQDAVIVARVKNAFAGQVPFHYAVIDPYMAAQGYENPMLTAGVASEAPETGYVVLAIHGTGAEGWRAAAPKAKWVMINLPFNTINVAPMPVKKGRMVGAIILEVEGTNRSSLVLWDGKKYRWRDMGGPGE